MSFVLLTLGLGIISAIPGIVLGRLLAVRGMVRKRPVEYTIVTVGLTFLIRSLDSYSVLGWLMLAVVSLGGAFSFYKYDWWIARKKGKRWWLMETGRSAQPDRWDPAWHFVIFAIVISLVYWKIAQGYPK